MQRVGIIVQHLLDKIGDVQLSRARRVPGRCGDVGRKVGPIRIDLGQVVWHHRGLAVLHSYLNGRKIVVLVVSGAQVEIGPETCFVAGSSGNVQATKIK
ncbi:hypothetical protein D9M69_711690 [compost metagenome]